jgi:hypothetical protein
MYLASQRFFAPAEAFDHGRSEGPLVQSRKFQAVPGVGRQQAQECVLGPAIPLPKRVDCIERRDEVRRFQCEALRAQSGKVLCLLQAAKELLHLIRNALGIAESAGALVCSHRAIATSPTIDVLK